jgi:hypothetical protein
MPVEQVVTLSSFVATCKAVQTELAQKKMQWAVTDWQAFVSGIESMQNQLADGPKVTP